MGGNSGNGGIGGRGGNSDIGRGVLALELGLETGERSHPRRRVLGDPAVVDEPDGDRVQVVKLGAAGPAGDDEVLGAVIGALPAGTAVGRGNVAGALGHGYAVAYGLLETALRP